MMLLLVVTGILAATSSWAAKNPELYAKGQKVFQTNCVLCHGAKGDGAGPAGAALKPPPRNYSTDKFKQGCSEKELLNTVTKGVPGTAMASFSSLPEDDRKAVAHYIFHEFVNGKNPNCKKIWEK